MNKLPSFEREHAKIQGMLLEIGNSKESIKDTYTNDKRFIFNNKPLVNLSTLKSLPLFTYEKIIKETVRFFDVIWFNKRGFPNKIFEVEQSTDFRDALIKFIELQDFKTEFYCIATNDRKIKFEREINKNAFSEIKERCKFLTYKQVYEEYELILKKSVL